ncbi:hypothetical protein [Jiangella mangrovi]|uniref:Uncharacterized protein n=1 Tax=Jiangella mangrovi TaxID=1524084 RepID=A0A7W9LJD4_9ACTN|nr:hypothetical protein [Jiangella mangrovi]MBB5785996.1 hypothetical protein [Jiangella mangrovi]
MPGSKPAEAYDAFLEPLQKALSCITNEPLIGRENSRKTGGKRTLTFPGDPAGLGGSGGLALTVSFEYEIYKTGDTGKMKYRCRTHGYKHQIVTDEFAEVILFHWHPGEAEDRAGLPQRPHIHMGTELLAADGRLTRRNHLPSGRVSLEDVVEFAITDLGVTPLRDDWQTVIDNTRALFEKHRTWGGRGLNQ